MSSRTTIDKGRPDYYLTPSQDFTQYTRDSEEKYWNKETKFDWNQSVQENLKLRLERLDEISFSKLAFMVLPMIEESLARKMVQVSTHQLPMEEDALKDISECIVFDKPAIQQAFLIQSPLKDLQLSVSKLSDHFEILTREFLDLREQQRLGFFKNGIKVNHLKTEAERQEQALQLSELTQQITRAENDLAALNTRYEIESGKQKMKIRAALDAIEPRVLLDLRETQALIQRVRHDNRLPVDAHELLQIKDLILKRQLRGLKDIANHALVVEQSAIAPLTMGIIHYKRYREIQEAMTTFINDEAKHSATFRRFLVDKLEAREYISAKLIKGASRYMWLARFMPGAGLFLAVIVEAIGAAYLEFFGDERYMPDQLFCSICQTISLQDEKRHMDLCAAMYNELFRNGSRWERIRNQVSLKAMMKSVYGDKTEDHHLIQAFRAFGVESDLLYRHVVGRLSQQLARISMYVQPERLLEIIGRK